MSLNNSADLGSCPKCQTNFADLPNYAQPRDRSYGYSTFVCPNCHYALDRDESSPTLWSVVPNLGTCSHCNADFAATPNRPYCIEPGDVHYCGKCGWRNVRDESVPGKWVEGETYDQKPLIPAKTIKVQIPTYEQFLQSLDRGGLETVRKVGLDNNKLSLWESYRRELIQLLLAAIDPNCQEPVISMNLFETGTNADGSPYRQRTAFFACSDRARPVKNEYNFHGQNVSQWAGHAGCILVDDEDISSHH